MARSPVWLPVGAAVGLFLLPMLSRAAIPTATIAVSARVVPRCESVVCGAPPGVVRYRQADEPVFELAPDVGNRVLTVTY